MVRIRMQRLGRTHRPFYRINAIDIRTSRNGKVIENLGWYNPVAPEGEQQIHLKEDRIRDWLSRGAQPSETMMDMLGHHGLLNEKQMAAWEAGREKARNRVVCKKSLVKIEAALKTLEEMAKSSETDVAPATEAVNAALVACKRAVSGGRIEKAEAAAAEAEAALEALKEADQQAQAAEETSQEEQPSEESAEG